MSLLCLPLVADTHAFKALIKNTKTGLSLVHFSWENPAVSFFVRPTKADGLDNLHALKGHLTKRCAGGK